MTRVKICLVILSLILCLSCSSQKAGQNVSPQNSVAPTTTAPRNSVDVVKVRALPVELKVNETVDAVVEVSIQNGYHINANPPTLPYLIATELTLPKSPDISLGYVVYPDALTKTFSFAEKPLAVYEGTVNIKARVKPEKSAKPGTQNLSAKLRVQACDDQVCYAPGTLDVTIPLSIK